MRTFTTSLLLLFVGLLSAAEGEITVPSKISGAKVYLSGAMITRTATRTLPAGASTLVFTDLSQQLDPQSIQVNGKGGFAIMSVNKRMNYLTESPKKKEIEELQAKVKKLEKDWAYEKAMQDVLVNEEQLLQKNSVIGGQQNGLTASQLTAVNDYVRERLRTTKANWLTQQEKLTAIGEEADKLRQQLAQLQAQAPRPTSEVVVEIDVPVSVSASFTLSYFVQQAGWSPAYDLRAEAVGKPIELVMKASIVNNTGEDWDKVTLALSSGNPTLGGMMPDLHAWILDQPMILQSISAGKQRGARSDAYMDAKPAAAPSANGADMELYEDMNASTTMTNTVVYRTTTVEFAIDAPFSVPSDNAAHMVGVRSHVVPAIYKHYCTPKLEKDAFLYARTTGWEDLNLLPGEANVFFEGTYVGRSFLDLSRPQDTLNISLGRDKGVVVQREKRKGFSEKPVVGGKRTVTIGWDITVRNTKGTAIDLELRDQYPVSQQSEVEVKLEAAEGAVVNKDKALLTWNVSVAAKEIRKLGFTYSVKHPKEQPVVLE